MCSIKAPTVLWNTVYMSGQAYRHTCAGKLLAIAYFACVSETK